MNNNPEKIKIFNATKDDISVIRELAFTIWPETYKEILSLQQLNYMLEYLYSPAFLEDQMNKGHCFLLVTNGDESIAFASYNQISNSHIFKLQKLYVSSKYQGKGIGKMLIEYLIEKVKGSKATALYLNVNRQNKAKLFYEHLGFRVIGKEDIDIGKGYFMNDYIMELTIT